MISIRDLVGVKKLTVHDDDRGSLYEVLRSDEYDSFIDFGQNYIVRSRQDAVRGFHYHDKLVDHFTIVSGSAIFCLWSFGNMDDPREAEKLLMEEYKKVWPDTPSDYEHILGDVDDWFLRLTVTGERPVRIDVPPGVVHGWMALEPNTVLLSTGSNVYNRENPDEHRLPWNLLGTTIWRIQNK